ncbi:MAG: hypothetical protein QOJ00_205 [Actinomycetota bacterium]
MLRGRHVTVVFVAAFCALTGPALATVDPVVPTVAGPAVAPPPGAPPKAYIVVDQATGRVMAASNERVARPPASMSKILTALVTVAALAPTDTVPVSERAAAMPAHKLSMKSGEVWPVDDVLHALLQSSANDAGAALAERVSGSLENFGGALDQLAAQLHMADAPVLQDPSGLDDSTSIGGGNLVSARDLAIATRALLNEPRLAPIVAAPVSRFTDPGGVPHRLINHNKLLTRYFGAVGVKTGYTRKAGRGLIAAATRNGRTEIVVVMSVDDTYGWAAALLDAAFAAPLPAVSDRLPAVPTSLTITAVGADNARASRSDRPTLAATPRTTAARQDRSTAAAAPDVRSAPLEAAAHTRGLSLSVLLPLGALATIGLLVALLRLRLVVVRRRRRNRRRRVTNPNAAIRHHPNRRRDPHLTTQYEPHEHMKSRFHDVVND